MATTGLDRINHLDASQTKEKAFRLKTILAVLPTKDRLFRHQIAPIMSPVCERCVADHETQSHLWTCPHSQDALPAMLETFTTTAMLSFPMNALQMSVENGGGCAHIQGGVRMPGGAPCRAPVELAVVAWVRSS